MDSTEESTQQRSEEVFAQLQRKALSYFLHQCNPANGLVADKNQPGSPASIAVQGMAFSIYAIASECGAIERSEAIKRTLTALRFFQSSTQNTGRDATGYRGFYYHFLDIESGKRTWKSELSTIDTAILMAGIISAMNYFNRDSAEEREIRELANFLYSRVEWDWACNGEETPSHGWTPEGKFRRYRWDTNYSEAHILYILALGSPTYPIKRAGYEKWLTTFNLQTIYDIQYLHAGPLFIHQMSHLWIDFQGIQDSFNRNVGIDYFENSRRATYVQREYGRRNPKKFEHYSQYGWGLTASDGPGPAVLTVKGRRRVFYDYRARGVPKGPDDGTVSPWAVVASLPFAPEIVTETVTHMFRKMDENGLSVSGFGASYNLTFPHSSQQALTRTQSVISPGEVPSSYDGWLSPWIFGLNEGPMFMMIENHRSGLLWNLMKQDHYMRNGLMAAGFEGGWLADP
ncbi:MAG: hypothetical protein KGS72_09085 [Cyanobacteria bacterium REEB67]|nr:hypothetical protein [Cyanobacteria bacterium REEB67]